MEKVLDGNIIIELCKNGVVMDPCYANDAIKYIISSYSSCLQNGKLSYQNHVLGWYPFNGEYYYFLDKTYFGNSWSETTRDTLIFEGGDMKTYLQFLKDTVFPSTELSLALAIGYSAIVISRLNQVYDLRTIVVNLCGESSTGKSTAEMLMCSPFMNPVIRNSKDSLCFSSNNTLNAIFKRIDGVFGVPFVIDDLTTNPNINISSFIYTMTDGNNKGRLNGDSTMRDDGTGWNGIAITSSEMPILEKCEKLQGLEARVIHTQGIKWTKSAAEADTVKNTVSKHFGFTGKQFAAYISNIDINTLCNRYQKSIIEVGKIMIKKDHLSDRLANKYAAIHLTIELLNEAFKYGLSNIDLMTCLIKCEQDCIEERDNATKAYDYLVEYVASNPRRFITETKFSDPINNYYNDEINRDKIEGKITKYDSYWEVKIASTTVKEVLARYKLSDELISIRKKWIDRGLSKVEKDHNTKKVLINGISVRCDCLIIDKTSQKTDKKEIVEPTETIKRETPVSNYYIDDSNIIDEMFNSNNNGGSSDEN